RGENGNEIRRRVRFDQPVRPRDLHKEVPRDLETICLRCLCKRPEDRYASAQEVADALGRFLGMYPIEACPWPKRLWYFVRRHRAVTATACIGLVLLTAALSFLARSLWENRCSVALDAFEEGRKSYAEGRVTEGYNRMRGARDLLPLGETVL